VSYTDSLLAEKSLVRFSAGAEGICHVTGDIGGCLFGYVPLTDRPELRDVVPFGDRLAAAPLSSLWGQLVVSGTYRIVACPIVSLGWAG
jgi:hypothetical protein